MARCPVPQHLLKDRAFDSLAIGRLVVAQMARRLERSGGKIYPATARAINYARRHKDIGSSRR